MSIHSVTKQDLITAGYHSMSAGAGFDPETAADLGFTTPDNFEDQVETGLVEIEMREQREQAEQKLAPAIGSAMCGDCLVEVAPGKYCVGGHMQVSKNGQVKILG